MVEIPWQLFRCLESRVILVENAIFVKGSSSGAIVPLQNSFICGILDLAAYVAVRREMGCRVKFLLYC